MEPGTNWQMIHKDVEKSNNSPWHTHTHTYTERENTHGQDVSSRVWLATRGQLYTLPVSFFLPYLISIMTLKVSWRRRALMRVHATKKKIPQHTDTNLMSAVTFISFLCFPTPKKRDHQRKPNWISNFFASHTFQASLGKKKAPSSV